MKYIIVFYQAILFIGGNEMGPTSDVEIIICSVILIVSVIFNAWLFGEMAMLVDQQS
jgi:hypothetical protein